MEVRIDDSWRQPLAHEFKAPYFDALATFVKSEYQHATVYPPPKYVFRAFDLCPFNAVTVVILGQDPYHGVKQANGLAFAVDSSQPVPPSLQNIFKEIESDLGQPLVHRHGDLSRWATQGVLLLNSTLTVRSGSAGSHQGHGWEQFTDAAIGALSKEREYLVFMLWGNYAKAKGVHIDRTKHLVLESPHPSPFSAQSGFFGAKHFSKANEYLIAHNRPSIDWL
jgi:uracil-DNA glycosylase